jgi:hypothetical protein
MKAMLMAATLVLAGCPLTVIDSGPCRACRIDCDDGPDPCDECRQENCPDMEVE